MSRNVELLIGLLDQAVVLYASFVGGLMMVVGAIMWHWMKMQVGCYSWSFGASLELLWTLIPVAFLLFITMHSLGVLYAMDSTRMACSGWVSVIGHQWYWEYSTAGNSAWYDSRLVSSASLPFSSPRLSVVDSVLFLPSHAVSGVSITSVDVLHSWSVPSLGIKLDAVPGRNSLCSILPRSVGVVGGYCAELCGVGHAFMPILVCCYSF
jgi:heme/copper-type cytochrome/quinol oxidase subunit 2